MSDTNEPLIVDVDLKESDLQRANFWFRLGKWSTWLYLVMLLVGGLLVLWRFKANLFDNPPMATVIIVSLALPVLYPLLVWYQTKRGFSNLQGFQTQIHYSFSSVGYTVRDMKSSADIDWDAILRAAESKHSFHLFFHKSFFHTIPKRCFKQPDDIVRLRNLLKRSLGSKASVS
ncbi:MAG: YcxB family protein [Pyrinomonadaceae bacterium]